MVIVVSNMAVDLLTDALRSIIRGLLINIPVDNAFEFIMPERLVEFDC